jgi:putative ABC transport system substrate-binding protein
MEQDRADALMVSDEAEHLTNLATIVELAAKGRIPTIYPFREFVEGGGLMAYSIDLPDTFRRLASLVDKVLRGANPADIPFFQPTKFEMSINLKTAKALGLEMPAMLLGRAGLKRAIENGWLKMHESGTFMRFTQAGADLFA